MSYPNAIEVCTNEMLIATYKMAEKRKDSKTMERSATAYGKLNRVDLEFDTLFPGNPESDSDDESIR